MKRLLVVAVFVLAIVGMTVLCASAAETTGYANDEAALAADSTFVARIGEEGTSTVYYTKLGDACKAAPNNATVYVIQSYTNSGENATGGSKTLYIKGVDLGDGTYPTITHTSSNMFSFQGGIKATISDLNINVTGGYFAYVTGNATFANNVSITGTAAANHFIVFPGTSTSGTKTLTFGNDCELNLTLSGKMLSSSVAGSTIVFDGATASITTGGTDTMHNLGNMLITGDANITITGGGDGIENRGTLIMESGTLNAGSNLALYNNAGTAYFFGGTVTGTYAQNGTTKAYILGANYAKATASSVYFSDEGAAASGLIARYNSADTKVTLPDETVVSVRPYSAFYASVYDAVNACANGGTVYVFNDYTVTKKLNMDKAVTIRSWSDLESERVTLTLGISHFIDTDGNLATSVYTFDYININALARNMSYLNRETLVIGKYAYVYGTGTGSYGLLYADNNSAKIVVEGKVEITSGANAAILAKQNCVVEVSGTVTRAAAGYLFNIQGNASLTITSGTFQSPGTNMFYLNGTGVTVEIEGGDFTYTTANSAEFIRIEKIKTLTLSGGTFDRAGGADDKGTFFYYVDANDNGTLKVENTFTPPSFVYFHNVVEFADIASAANIGMVARIGNTLKSNIYYKDLASAVAAVSSNGNDTSAAETTIYIIADVTQATSLSVGSKNIVFESVGNTPFTVNVTYTAGHLFDYKDGSLRFKNVIFNKDSGSFCWISTNSKFIVDEGGVIQGKVASGSFVQVANAGSSMEVKRGGTVKILAGASGAGATKLIDAGGNGTNNFTGTITIAGTVEHAGTATGQAFVFFMPAKDATLSINNGARIILSAATSDTWSAMFRVDSTIEADATPVGSEEAHGILLKTTSSTHWGIRSPNSNSYSDTFIGVTFDFQTPAQIANDAGCFQLMTLKNVSFTSDANALAAATKAGSYFHMVRLGNEKNTMEGYTDAYTGYYINYSLAIADAPKGGATTDLYLLSSTVARIGNTKILEGQNIVLKGTTHYINGSNATYFLHVEAGASLTVSGVAFTGCSTQFVNCAGDFALVDGASFTIEANANTSETTPVFYMGATANFTLEDGTTIALVYTGGEAIEGEPGYKDGPNSYYVIDLASGWTGTGNVGGTISTAWNVSGWNALFRVRGTGTINVLSTANLTMTGIGATAGNAMFIGGANDAVVVTVESGATLSSTAPLFDGGIYFAELQDAVNAGMVARLGDDLKVSNYYKTLLAAISAVPANDTVVTIITNTSTTTIYSPASGNYKAGQNGTKYNFVLSAINGAVLTSSSAWMFDLGNGASVVPTLRDITVNLGSKNLGYLNNVDVVIDDGAYIYGTGSSAAYGMFYCLNGTVITVKEGAKIELTSGAFPMFALEGKSAVNATSAELVYSGTGYVFYGNGSGTSTITGTDIDVSAGGLVTVLKDKTNSFTFTNCDIDATISQDSIDFVAIVGTGAAVTFAGGDIDVAATYSTGNNPIMTSAGTLTFDGGDIDFTTNAMDLIHNTGTFVIKGTTDLSITGGGDGIENKATFIMTGGTITSSGLALYNNNSKAYITGGTINGTYTHNTPASTFTYIVGSTASFAEATSASVYRDTAAAVKAGYVAYTAASVDAGFTAVEFPAAAGGATYNVCNDYKTTLDAAAKLVSAEKSVIVLIANFTQTASMYDPAASFTLTSINNAVLTVKTSWLFDLGDGSAVVPTIKNIEIVIPSGYNLGYFNNASAIIDTGAYIHGVGVSGKGLIYGYAGFDLTVKDGAKIVVDSGSNTGIYAQTSSTINIEGGEFIYNSTGHNILSIYSSSILNITGGTFTYNSGANAIVYVNGATANISGGTFVSYGAAGSSIVRYAAKTSKVHLTGSPVLIHEGSGVGYVFYRDNGNLVIEGEGVKLIARGENYLFEQAYQDAIADFNNTDKLIITGAYLSTERTDGVMVQNDPSYYTFSNVTLDFDNALANDKRQPASVLHGGSYYYFAARIDNGDSAREIVLPATKAYPEGRTLTVYGGYYTTFDAAWKAATGNDFDIYVTKDQTGIARKTYVINGNVTLYLNGHTVAAAEANDVLFNVKAGATLTILNGTITCSNRFVYAYGTVNLGDAEGTTGALTITDPGKITTHMFYGIGAGEINVYKNATLQTTTTASVGGCNYIQLESNFAGSVNVYGQISLNHAVPSGAMKMFRVTGSAGGSVNVYDGAELTFNCNFAAANNEHAVFYNYNISNFTYNVYGGTIKNTSGKGVIFFAHIGTVNVSGGELESNGAYGVYAYNASTINISGGKFTSKGTATINVYAKDTANVSVTGGTFIAESTVNTHNVYFNQTTALTIKDATFIHNGTGSNLTIANSSNNVYIKGNTTITHNGTASTSNIALNRGGGKYVYVDGTDADLKISAPNGAYILRTAYFVEFKNCSVLGSCTTLGTESGEDFYGQFNNVIVPADMVDNWLIAVAVGDGTTTWAYSKTETTTLDSTYFGYAVAKLTAMEATDVTLYFGENLKLDRLSGSYNLPAGKNIAMSGFNKTVSVNGSNGQSLFTVPETTALSITNVTFSDCPCNFAKVYGALNLGAGTNLIIYTTTANDSANKHEVSPVIELYYDAVVTMADGATIQLLYMDSDATNTEPADYAADFHVFQLDSSFYGALTISGDITYNWYTTGISAFVYAESTASGSLTITDTATLVYNGVSTNGTATTNAYLVLYGSPNVSVAQSVYENTTTYANYPFCIGLELGLDNGFYVPVTPEGGFLVKLASPTSVAYYKTIAEAHAMITAKSTQYAIVLLGNYTFADADRKTFSGAYYLTVSGINPDITITETVSGYMWVIKAGAQLTLRNIKIVTNGAVVQNDAGGTNTYLTLAKGTKIIGSGKLSGTFFDLWNAANFTLEHGAEIDTTGTTASSQIELIHAENSCQKPINIAGKITHGTKGSYNHKIFRTSSAPNQAATVVINILGTAELIYNCPDIAANSKEGAIIHNYTNKDLYATNFQINVYDGAKLQHNTNGSIFFFASYGTKREVNIYGGTFEVNGGASFAHLTCGSTMNLMGGTIKITDGDYLFGGDQTGTYYVSGNVTLDLANVALFQASSKLYVEEVHFNGSNITLILGENVTTAAANADTRYVVHNASQFADDATAALFLASYRTGGVYYTDLKTVIGATTAEDSTVYVVRDDVNGKRVTGGISITGKSVIIDGLGHSMNVNGANEQFLFAIAADGALTLKDVTLTNCPTKLASVAGALTLQNADVVLYTKVDNEAIVNETSPLVYLTGAATFAMDEVSTINFTYADGDDREFVDNQANIYVFHTASDWNGTMNIDGTVTMGWNVEGRFPIFYLESTAGKITLAKTAVVKQTGTASAAGTALVMAPENGTTEFYIYKGAEVSTTTGIMRLGNVTPMTAEAAEKLGYGDAVIVSITISWGAMTFDYTEPTWNTDKLRWEGYGFTPTAEGADQITFQNTGTVAIATNFTFTPNVGFEEITATYKSGDADAQGMEIEGNSDPVAVTILPTGLIPFNQSGQLTIGTLTISLTEGGNS